MHAGYDAVSEKSTADVFFVPFVLFRGQCVTSVINRPLPQSGIVRTESVPCIEIPVVGRFSYRQAIFSRPMRNAAINSVAPA